MSEEKKQEEKVTIGAPGQQQTRQLIVETDGQKWNIGKDTNISPLEIKEICREIIIALGG
jgi:hypothetical protein